MPLRRLRYDMPSLPIFAFAIEFMRLLMRVDADAVMLAICRYMPPYLWFSLPFLLIFDADVFFAITP